MDIDKEKKEIKTKQQYRLTDFITNRTFDRNRVITSSRFSYISRNNGPSRTITSSNSD